jgi:hypothetical protein
MDKIGTAGNKAFAGTALVKADITGLHTVGTSVFEGCTSLKTITTGKYTDIGAYMFKDCTALGTAINSDGLDGVNIMNPVVGNGAFYGCTGLKTVNFGYGSTENKTKVGENEAYTFTIGANAFEGCTQLSSVSFNGYNVASIGDNAFKNCTSLSSITLENGTTSFGKNVFAGTSAVVNIDNNNVYTIVDGAIYRGTELVLAPATITSSFAIKADTTSIGSYAFASSQLASGVTTINIPSTVTSIGEGAFAGLNIQTITLPEGITVIDDYTFSDSALTAITIPASVKTIGDQAFAGCTSLATITFAEGTQLVQTGNLAFANTAITTLAMPDGVKKMGALTFYNCKSLRTITLPSVEEIGTSTFFGCTALETATFGANAKVVGDSTFYIGTTGSSLTSVTLGGKTTAIGENAFAYCTKLTSIDLDKVTVIGEGAFTNCTKLAEVKGLENVVTIGDYAFFNCSVLKALNLTNAETIGAFAFANGLKFVSAKTENALKVGLYTLALDSSLSSSTYTTVSIPVVQTIGAYAFFGGSETTIALPATLTSFGDGALANSKLKTITIDAGNKLFFVEGDVLYRYIANSANGAEYELCAYPSAKAAPTYTDSDNVTSQKTYKIKDGTITVQPYAFAYLANYSNAASRSLAKVILPYSMLTIGDSAFYSSGITEFVFESITAPTLLDSYKYIQVSTTSGTMQQYSMYYTNFGSSLYSGGNLVQGSLKISYPSNGTGYDNFIYSYFFGESVELGELMNDDTRALKNTIEGFDDAETVKGWLSLEVNAQNTAMVQAFADSVKQAHADYLSITSETQLNYLGEKNVAKLSAIEDALKDVKTRFNIARKATSLVVNSNSTHKTAYKAGERFNMSGLSMTVVYDDYTEELADMSQISLDDVYDRELTVYDRVVGITGYGLTAYLPISVSSTNSGSNNGSSNSGKASGCGSVTTGGFDGGMMALAIGVCALAIVAKAIISKRRKDNQ